MEKITLQNMWLFGLLIGTCLWGCNDAKNDAITDNMAYIKDAYEKKSVDIYLDVSVAERLTVPVNLTRRDDTKDIQITLGASEAALESFNEKYGKTYKMYPLNLWSFESEQIVIKKGSTGAGATILVQPMTNELILSGNLFVIPVTIMHADNIGVLHGAETIFYVLKRIPITTVLHFPATGSAATVVKACLPHPSTSATPVKTTAMTVEFLIKIISKTNAHNYCLLENIGGWVEGQIFSRIEGGGTAGTLWNSAAFEWNIGSGEAISVAPPGGIALNQWYHIAFTFGKGKIQIYIDGQLMKSLDVGRTFIEWYGGLYWSAASFNTYYSPMGRNDVMSAELRVWETVRTVEELREYMYGVNPQTPGLLGYWKLNDGAGATLKDYANGRDGYLVGYIKSGSDGTTVQWPGKNFEWINDQNITIGQ